MSETTNDHLLVEAISNGTVIDHIAPGQAMNILRLFNFLGKHNHITVGFNLRLLILREGHEGHHQDFWCYLLPCRDSADPTLAPDATVNTIKDYKVQDKYNLRLPSEIRGAFECPNSNCITHVERGAKPCFRIFKEDNEVMMRCHYCERVFSRELLLKYNDLA